MLRPLLTPALLVSAAVPAMAQREARAVRIEIAPTIDGVLEPEVWEQGIPIGELTQIEPQEGSPSQRTDARFLYDDDNLYIGIRCHDDDPDKIIVTSRDFDASLTVDDRIELILDTFHDRRSAFFFQMNAAGSRGDALVSGNGNGRGNGFNRPWDGIWEGRTTIDDGGWTMEVRIPFKTLSFDPEKTTWGMNLSRFIGRRNEDARWNEASRDIGFTEVSAAGLLTGLEGIRQGVGLDVVPFYTANWRKLESGGDSDLSGEPGLDAFYKVTPNLTLSLTLNTDFAETEVDRRQINLTRFPLFFPERRDFFIEDAGRFDFGTGGTPMPFFSRRIGLVDGEEVPLLGGAKLTGKAGAWSLGLLDVQTDEATIDGLGTIDSQNLSVARISRDVGEQSRIGGIVTHGNPTDGPGNTVVGIDGQYRTSSFLDDKQLTATGWALLSDTDGVSGDQAAFGASLAYPNDVWNWNVSFQEIQEDFDAALGFVPRRDIREYETHLMYRPRIDDHIKRLRFHLDTNIVTDTDDVLETWWARLEPFAIEWQSGDELAFEVRRDHDELRQEFEISDGVVLPPGAYDWERAQVRLNTARNRRLSTRTGLSVGDFYSGTRNDWWVVLSYRTGPLLRTELEFRQNDVDLEEGSFTNQIAGARLDFSFTPDISWNSFVQWDNVSETIGLQSRVRWIPEAGQEVYLVLNESFDENGDSLVVQGRELAFKVGYTFRF